MWDREFDREELYYSSLREAREEAWEEAWEESAQKERIQVAQRFLADGLDNDTIARYTTLPLPLIEQLRSQLVAGVLDI